MTSSSETLEGDPWFGRLPAGEDSCDDTDADETLSFLFSIEIIAYIGVYTVNIFPVDGAIVCVSTQYNLVLAVRIIFQFKFL